MSVMPLFNPFFLLASGPFSGLQHSFGNLLLMIFGLVAMVSLAVTVIHVIQGEKESAKKALRWLVVTAVGFILLIVLRDL